MFCAFVGAGIGNYLRCKLTKHHFTLFLCIVSSVSLACFAYAGLLKLGEILFGISVQHEAGYICAMLFIIPGFPFITSGIDLAKLDMRSGIERLTYALIVILVATMSAWIMALILHLKPVDFIKLSLSTEQWILFRLLASFCGVFGFSIMFNSRFVWQSQQRDRSSCQYSETGTGRPCKYSSCCSRIYWCTYCGTSGVPAEE